MSVNLIYSLTNGGAAITSIVDHGDVSNGDTTTAKEIFVRHDGANEITSVGIYIRQLSGTYSGTFTPSTDFSEIIAWGDDTTANGFGGCQFNLLATTSYPASGWPTYTSKSPTGGFAARTGYGDSEGNAITLPTSTGAVTEGEIPAGASPNVRYQMRVVVPNDEDTLGVRQWESIIRYNYTS